MHPTATKVPGRNIRVAKAIILMDALSRRAFSADTVEFLAICNSVVVKKVLPLNQLCHTPLYSFDCLSGGY